MEACCREDSLENGGFDWEEIRNYRIEYWENNARRFWFSSVQNVVL